MVGAVLYPRPGSTISKVARPPADKEVHLICACLVTLEPPPLNEKFTSVVLAIPLPAVPIVRAFTRLTDCVNIPSESKATRQLIVKVDKPTL